MKTCKTLLAASVLTAVAATSSFAASINAASSGLMTAQTNIDFSEGAVTPGTQVTTEFQSLGVTFQPKLTLRKPGVIGQSYSARPNFADEALFNFSNDPFVILFEDNVSDATFAFSSNQGPFRFTAILNGTGVEQFTSSNTGQSGFFGFSGIEFNEILVTGEGANRFSAIDNLSFNNVAAVPLPAGLGLLLAALGGLGIAARRKTAAS